MTDNLLVSLMSDAASIMGCPTEIAKCFLRNRQKELQNIIESEIKEGDFSKVDKDDLISIVIRLFNDINEGVGKNNIRLMARVIVGLNDKDELTASKFHNFNTILANLSYEEIMFLADVIREYKTGLPKEIYNKPDNPKEVAVISKIVNQNKNGHVLLSLLKTGFLEPFFMPTARMQYKISPLFLEFMDLIKNWEDIATWEKE